MGSKLSLQQSIFSPGFAQIVSEVRQDLVLHVGEDEAGLAFFWPMHVSRGGVARGVGGPFSDRNGPVTRPGFVLDAPTFLRSKNIRCFITGGYVPSDGRLTDGLRPVLNNETHLKGDLASFLKAQKANHPAHVKRLYRLKRKLEREHSEIVFRFDDTSTDAFDKLISLKREQHRRSRLHDVLGPDWVVRMFRKLWDLNGTDLQVRLSSLYVDGAFTAGELNLQAGPVLHGWITAFDPVASRYSPGNILTQTILEHMLDHGLDCYDSGVGGDHYKKYIANTRPALGFGTLRTGPTKFSPGALTSSAWSLAERRAPTKLSTILARARRRSDMIQSTEVEFLPMLKGYLSALNVKL